MAFLKKYRVNIIIALFVILFIGALYFVLRDEKKNDEGLVAGTYYARITIENYGEIELELYADIAPVTVTNFINLVKEGFYDGLTIHRVQKNFVIQGGSPNGSSVGGSGTNIKGEFSANGIENKLSHERGVISMARSEDPDSASSQFFIMHQDYKGLDGNYAAFGKVTSGMDVVDKICEEVPAIDSGGTVLAANQPKITSIRMFEKPIEE